MIKIITDSTSYMPKEFAVENDITVIPLKFLVADKEVVEGFPDTFEEHFKMVDEWGEIPKTSQPSLEVFMEEYEKVISAGNEAIVITISSSLSGTHSAATLAKNSCSNPDKISIIDSGSCGPSMWGYIMEILEDIKNEKNREEIIQHIEDLKVNSSIFFCPDSFEHLKKGGRIGSVTAIIGSIIKIKPLLTFNNGKLANTKNVIGSLKAITAIIESIPKKAKKIFIIKIHQSKFFQTLKDGIYARFPNTEKIIADFGPVVGAHIGPAIGASWICEL